jgi:hypothetical protein
MSNQLELLHEACRFNNAGAAFLASNDGGSAVQMLKNALVIMERLSRDEDSEDLIMIQAPKEAIHYPFVEVPGMDDTFFVYNRALVLDSSPSNGVDLAFANAAILFNLALAFHQRGMTSCQAAKLRRAIPLYELAVRLVADVSSAQGALAIAALNNQAHIHRELCEFNEACLVLNQVCELAEHVPNSSSADAFGAELFDDIFLNVTMSSQIPSTAASA